MRSVLSRRRLSSISERKTSGRPRPGPPIPPFVATMQFVGVGESAAPIVSSLCPPVYECAVSIICTPAATAALIKATLSGVFVSWFVPSPIRAASMSPTFIEFSSMMAGSRSTLPLGRPKAVDGARVLGVNPCLDVKAGADFRQNDQQCEPRRNPQGGGRQQLEARDIAGKRPDEDQMRPIQPGQDRRDLLSVEPVVADVLTPAECDRVERACVPERPNT